MGQELTKIKKRIQSVSSAYKVTGAMKLVSTVKLRKWKSKMLANKQYKDLICSLKDELFSYVDEFSNPYFNANDKCESSLYIVVSSTLGLCGSYNQNIFRLGDKIISPNDDLIVLGAKGIKHYANHGKLFNDFPKYNNLIDRFLIKDLTSYILNGYEKKKFKEVHFIYSKYVNSITFLPTDFTLLPLKNNNIEASKGFPPIMEPSKDKLLNDVVDLYLKSIIYSLLLESEVCEQASRSNAMENATKNAESLLENLHIEFNKARQSAITQEIVEIVAASKEV